MQTESGNFHAPNNLIACNKEISLATRTFLPVWFDNNATEMDSIHRYSHLEIDVNKTALILIDVWACSNDIRLECNVKTKIVPLLKLAREQNMPIIHVPHDRDIHEHCQPLDGELITGKENRLSDTGCFDKYLQSHNISNLLYAGYRSNWCVLHRPTGIVKMSELGYNVILIRDCTIAMETPETLEGEWANKVSVNMVESQFGSTTTLKDLLVAFGEADDLNLSLK